eukprot:TRINITY_DN2763_c0_g1_i1.p1 TRINITY_DN2763_c0_g1~~TRINITY_DN2763_c0_g1_i1.p1  ORF type:complete len:182 (-),score=29.43 TRINITY_DN2763_c0_g1_i1:17-562(-)
MTLRQRKVDDFQSEFLDSSEQDELIDSMYKRNEWWNTVFKYAVCGICGILGMVKLFATIDQIRNPFNSNSHILFWGVFPSWFIVLSEWYSFTGYFLTGIAAHPYLLRGYLKQWANIMHVAISILLYLAISIWSPDLFFANGILLGGNVVLGLACYYVNTISNSSKADIIKLRSHTYSFKKA